MTRTNAHKARIKSIEFLAEPQHAAKILINVFYCMKGFLPKHLNDKEACVKWNNAKRRNNLNAAIKHTTPDTVEIFMYMRTIKYDRLDHSWTVDFIDPSLEDAGNLLKTIAMNVYLGITVENIHVVNERDQVAQGG